MTITMPSNRAFNQDVNRAKRAADDGPVIIADPGEPAYGLLRHEDYRRLTGGGATLREMLAQPGLDDFEVDPPRLGTGLWRPADLA